MQLLKDKILLLLRDAVARAFPDRKDVLIVIDYPTGVNHGEYATPIALQLGGNPKENAKKIIEAIEPKDWIEKIEVAGPGFVNFFISAKFSTDFVFEIIKEAEEFGSSDAYKGKSVVTDISHPNIAKPMGIHHILSTIIGDSLNRIFAATGYKLVRDNYLGDWGTQFGKLIYAYKTWGDEAKVKMNPIPELLQLYVKFHKEAEVNFAIEDLGRAEFKKLEDGDEENKKLWQWVVDLSKSEFEKTYKRLDINFDMINGESFYEDKMGEIIDLGINMGVFVEGERGALIVPMDDDSMPPAITRKSDGATLYATRDLARIKYWEKMWNPDLMINVVDVAQELYFKQLFEVVEKLNITDAENIHVKFGRMSFPEKKMSTRKGDVLLLEEVMDEAVTRAYNIVVEKNNSLPEAQKREVAEVVGIGALKYAILSQNRTTNVVFTWDKMLSLEGNSAPYLQYTYARAASILRKVEAEESGVSGESSGVASESSEVASGASGVASGASEVASGASEVASGASEKTAVRHVFSEPSELEILRLLPRFPEVVIRSAELFAPSYISTYLFELAQAFNSFYAAESVLKAEPHVKEARKSLVKAVQIVLKNGLKLLGGINVPEEM